ncbi:SAM-dependent methyltransferase [Streptomyces tateyamensis]|uniref:SAM-dependent methyltransferase n=1 Tax=Streptomyces tateyamensis TaxID=565073 RepID=A0A2V4P2T4_9ACTN|nr:class I SAM-dependent methyltransferase [Streptomyces tateyamensis]PYC78567.1 SAM-dependent methyltransferase [Streptomyces tateyamensis]
MSTEPDFLRTTRASYDAVAEDYTVRFVDELAIKPLDRAMLAAFAGYVCAGEPGPVADLGCGPGRVTDHLRGLGVDAFGVDLSPRMVEQARRIYPELRFEVGSMTELSGFADGSLAGIVAWYSLIHLPTDQLPAVLAEFHRILAPGGHFLTAFQVGDELRHRTEAFGHPIDLTFRRRRPEQLIALLAAAGLELRAQMVREPAADGMETVPQAFLLAVKQA